MDHQLYIWVRGSQRWPKRIFDKGRLKLRCVEHAVPQPGLRQRLILHSQAPDWHPSLLVGGEEAHVEVSQRLLTGMIGREHTAVVAVAVGVVNDHALSPLTRVVPGAGSEVLRVCKDRPIALWAAMLDWIIIAWRGHGRHALDQLLCALVCAASSHPTDRVALHPLLLHPEWWRPHAHVELELRMIVSAESGLRVEDRVQLVVRSARYFSRRIVTQAEARQREVICSICEDVVHSAEVRRAHRDAAHRVPNAFASKMREDECTARGII
mmetsp:Transcript_4466/g.11766  ORF Transcript_4466/g.11766 Transcript_4466/m.11766 type:complete len:268 (+) Transcript_4466:1695-2498(+)